MTIIKRLFVFFLSLFQMLFGNVIFYSPVTEKADELEKTYEIVNDIYDDTDLASTIIYANEVANTVDGYYSNGGDYAVYTLENRDVKIDSDLKSVQKTTSVFNKDGKAYFENTVNLYYKDKNGIKYNSNNSISDVRANLLRFGEYYYENHIRDIDFGLAINTPFKGDIAYHMYPDKVYQQFYLYASEASLELRELGVEVEIPVRDVEKICIKDKNGKHDSLKNIDFASVEFIAFAIKNVGTVGFIIPVDTTTGAVSVEKCAGKYIFTEKANYTAGTGINKFDETGGYDLNYVTFGYRLFTDDTFDFSGIEKASYEEHNPLDSIEITGGAANGKFKGYEPLRGTYLVSMDGTGFSEAYYNEPDRHYTAEIAVKGDSCDRTLYFRTNADNGGQLEAAGLLNESGTLLPVDAQVSKNFQGDIAEHFYSIKDYSYSDSFFPVCVEADSEKDFTALNVYQNWGKFPLKQISSIEFHTAYYHLSTGVTESNCIAPYFTYQDGWLLPDFRGRSGKIWDAQPQFNSVGCLYFVNYMKTKSEQNLSTYKNSTINSDGFAYSDIIMDYVSDCGSYEYTLRHVEFPQTDENRTYYTVEIEFLRDITFKNFKRDFALFSFDGRDFTFTKKGYLNSSNEPTNTKLDLSADYVDYQTLGTNGAYMGYYSIADGSEMDRTLFGSNMAVLVKNSAVVIGGEKSDISLVFKDEYSAEDKLNTGSLTLDAERLSFKTGDTIKLNLILLPWGTGDEETDGNVLAVREDSVLNPLTVKAATGTVIEDDFLPIVKAENNVAEFTVTGGRNNNAVRINGFTSLKCPNIYMQTENGWEKVNLASANGYDGYTVYYDKTKGLYDFSFVYNADDPFTEYIFRCVYD